MFRFKNVRDRNFIFIVFNLCAIVLLMAGNQIFYKIKLFSFLLYTSIPQLLKYILIIIFRAFQIH